MTKTAKTDTQKSANGGCKVNVDETIVSTYMLLLYMMTTNKMMLTNTSLAMDVKTAMTIEPLLFNIWFRIEKSFFV